MKNIEKLLLLRTYYLPDVFINTLCALGTIHEWMQRTEVNIFLTEAFYKLEISIPGGCRESEIDSLYGMWLWEDLPATMEVNTYLLYEQH